VEARDSAGLTAPPARRAQGQSGLAALSRPPPEAARAPAQPARSGLDGPEHAGTIEKAKLEPLNLGAAASPRWWSWSWTRSARGSWTSLRSGNDMVIVIVILAPLGFRDQDHPPPIPRPPKAARPPSRARRRRRVHPPPIPRPPKAARPPSTNPAPAEGGASTLPRPPKAARPPSTHPAPAEGGASTLHQSRARRRPRVPSRAAERGRAPLR